jgi:hypothetical protein
MTPHQRKHRSIPSSNWSPQLFWLNRNCEIAGSTAFRLQESRKAMNERQPIPRYEWKNNHSPADADLMVIAEREFYEMVRDGGEELSLSCPTPRSRICGAAREYSPIVFVKQSDLPLPVAPLLCAAGALSTSAVGSGGELLPRWFDAEDTNRLIVHHRSPARVFYRCVRHRCHPRSRLISSGWGIA